MCENQDSSKVINIISIIDEDQNTKVHYAAAFGILEKLQNLINNGHKIDAENFMGWTPLMMAARCGKLEVVKYLLDNKADASKKNKYDMNVFIIAVAGGNLHIISLLLKHLFCGGISRQLLQKIMSPLSISILFNNSEVFRYLLEQKFDVNVATPTTGLTPLMFAAAMNNSKAFKRLIAWKADTLLKNYSGRTAQDITLSKIFKMSVEESSSPIVPATTPFLLVSPSSPYYQYSPTAFNPTNRRTSSNIENPYYPSPIISPITPLLTPHLQQIFFPADFSPSAFLSPTPTMYERSNDFLNININTDYLTCFEETQLNVS